MARMRPYYSQPTKYGVGSGRIKVLESKLLGRSRLERLIEAKDFKEKLRILAETDYGELLEDVSTSSEVEEALAKYLAKTYQFLEEVCPPDRVSYMATSRQRPPAGARLYGRRGARRSSYMAPSGRSPASLLKQFFTLKYDFHNLKVFLKEKYLGLSSEDALSKLASLDASKISKWISEGNLQQFSWPFKEPLEKTISVYEKEKDVSKIDLIFDQAYYAAIIQIATEEKNDYLLNYAKKSVDLANLKIFVRAYKKHLEKDFFDEVLISGGYVEKEKFLSICQESVEKVLSLFAETSYYGIAKESLRSEKEIDLTFFDKLARNYLLEQAKKAKGIAVGPEVIIGYILAKENEVDILRTILIGTSSGLSKNRIREQVGELYV